MRFGLVISSFRDALNDLNVWNYLNHERGLTLVRCGVSIPPSFTIKEKWLSENL
jgi:hypothetical protein